MNNLLPLNTTAKRKKFIQLNNAIIDINKRNKNKKNVKK